MNEREILEACAEAANYTWVRFAEDGTAWWRENPDESRRWNPLTSDNDCAKLRQKLGISVLFFESWVSAAIDPTLTVQELFSDHANDRGAAERMATCMCVFKSRRG